LTFLFVSSASGDLAERVGGTVLRRACSILQSIQLIINVGIICLYVVSLLCYAHSRADSDPRTGHLGRACFKSPRENYASPFA
jgi:hypothetical protein